MVRVRICVKDDTQDQRLPFGASGSVASFLRNSAALVCIGQVCLGFWSCLFNFPTITLASLAAQCKSQVHLLFDLLGIDFVRDGEKAANFRRSRLWGCSLRTCGSLLTFCHWVICISNSLKLFDNLEEG